MKYCKDYAALLDPYIDGELPPEDTARVREHLSRCGGCRAYVQAALLLRENFPDIQDTEVPDGFAESVMGAIRSGAAPQRKRRSPWIKALVPLAACCAVVILAKSLPVRQLSAADTADAAMTETADGGTVPDGAAAARIAPPEGAETEQDASAAESDGQTPETDSKIEPDTGAAQPHVYAAPTGGQEDAAQPEAQAENGPAAEAAQASSWFATLILTPAQAGTALDDLPADTPVSWDPDTGGTVYWLTAEQFSALLERLDDPACTLDGDGESARVILLPE